MDRQMQKVLALMEENLQRELILEKIARSMNLSPSRLRHLFTAKIGMTPAQYLKLLRLRKAKELAEATPLTVKQIMITVGIRDESHFVRDFKKIYGLSPSQYRKECGDGAADNDIDGSDSQIG